MQNLHANPVASSEADASAAPDRIELAMTDIAEAAREGLLAMSVATGLAVMDESMEAEATALVGVE